MSIEGTTKLVGLIGNPVSHSLSPRMHNAAFAELGLDWAYVPLHVEDDLEHAIRGLASLGFVGANVTIPHKTAAVAYCDELDVVAERAGSVNTLVVNEGRILGSSTDGAAVVGAVTPTGAKVLLLGAGGAAQAVATALADAGAASISIAGWTPERRGALAARLRTLYPALEVELPEEWPPSSAEATLIVNATPVKEETLVPIAPAQQVVDLAYLADGRQTSFIAEAQRVGCKTIVDGVEVLVRQGAASFERWTGVRAPLAAMRAALRPEPGTGD